MYVRPILFLLICFQLLFSQDMIAGNSRQQSPERKAGHAAIRKQKQKKKSASSRKGRIVRKKKRVGKAKSGKKRLKYRRHTAKVRRPVTSLQMPASITVFSDSLRTVFLHSEDNRIIGGEGFAALKKRVNNGRVVRIVHLGDSHIQADMMTSVIRRGLQGRFGNAGRGLVFPYQLAATNAPGDIMSASSSVWSSGKLTRLSPGMECGISGFVVSTSEHDPDVQLRLRPRSGESETFSQVRLFTSGNNPVALSVLKGDPSPLNLEEDERTGHKAIRLSAETDQLFISVSSEPGSVFSFYGLSLEKVDGKGIIYDAIGVNGADYESYRRSETFWAQIGLLQADCYVLSLGTNDAQDQQLNADQFSARVREVVSRLREVSPRAIIVLATPPPSWYRQARFNTILETVSDSIRQVSIEEHVACWDLYRATMGANGGELLFNAGLFRPDMLHFNRQGYELQGEMLLEAFMQQFGAGL